MKYIRFFGSTGSYGTEYEYYDKYPDYYAENDIDSDSFDYAHDNAESYLYLYRGINKNWTEEEEKEYYENALSYCGWEYCTKIDYERNCE